MPDARATEAKVKQSLASRGLLSVWEAACAYKHAHTYAYVCTHTMYAKSTEGMGLGETPTSLKGKGWRGFLEKGAP